MATRQLSKYLNAGKVLAANIVKMLNGMNGKRRVLGKPEELLAHQALERLQKAEEIIAQLKERAERRSA